MAPKGGDFDKMVRTESDMSQAEAPADQKAVAEELFDLLGGRIGPDIKVFGRSAEQQVPHAAADQISQVTVAMQSVKDFESVFFDQASGDAVSRAGQYRRDGMIETRVCWSCGHGLPVVFVIQE